MCPFQCARCLDPQVAVEFACSKQPQSWTTIITDAATVNIDTIIYPPGPAPALHVAGDRDHRHLPAHLFRAQTIGTVARQRQVHAYQRPSSVRAAYRELVARKELSSCCSAAPLVACVSLHKPRTLPVRA